MKRIKNFIIIGFITSCFTGCTAIKEEETFAETQEVQEITLQEEEKVLENYATEFPDYEFTGILDETVGDRHFESEITPVNIAENLVFCDYYYDIKGEYEKLSGINGDNEGLKISAINEKKRFDEGAYMQDYIIHSLSTWTKADFKSSEYIEKHSITSDILKYQVSTFAIVQADISMVWSEEALKRGPQLENGEYRRLFLCGKKSDEDKWRIYEIYWFDD